PNARELRRRQAGQTLEQCRRDRPSIGRPSQPRRTQRPSEDERNDEQRDDQADNHHAPRREWSRRYLSASRALVDWRRAPTSSVPIRPDATIAHQFSRRRVRLSIQVSETIELYVDTGNSLVLSPCETVRTGIALSREKRAKVRGTIVP